MFADIRKKFCAALVGSLMFFGAPNCSAIGGAGVAMITGGVLSTLGGGISTFLGIISEIGGLDKRFESQGVKGVGKILTHIDFFVPRVTPVLLGIASIAGGTKL